MRDAKSETQSKFINCVKNDETNLLQIDGSYAGRIGSLHAMWIKAGRSWDKVLENQFHADTSKDPNSGIVMLARLSVLIAADWLAVELYDRQAEALKEAVLAERRWGITPSPGLPEVVP